MTENGNQILEFTLGDPSDDGHGHTDVFSVMSNRPSTFFKKSYKPGSGTDALNKLLGFDVEEIAYEYEDNTIRGTQLAKLIELGLLSPEQLEQVQRDEDYDEDDPDGNMLEDMDCEQCLTIWLKGLQLVDPDFKFEMLKPDYSKRVSSHMGYGCFSC